MPVLQIGNFEGIVASNEFLHGPLKKSLEVASALARLLPESDFLQMRRMSLMAAVNTVNALLAASSAKCTLANPPADIDVLPGSTGDLIMRCQHPQPHMWDLEGHKL